MARRSSDMTLLLLILLLFSASIGFLHGSKSTTDLATSSISEKLSSEDALDMVETLLLSGNMDQAAQMMMATTVPDSFIDDVVSNKAIPLTDAQKISLLVAVIAYQSDPEIQDRFLSKLAHNFGEQPIYEYVYKRYKPFIAAADRWAKQEKKEAVLNRWKQVSFKAAVMEDNVPILTWFYTNDIRPTREEASRLLDMVVSQGKDVSFIPLLVQRLNADVNYSADSKRTILMKVAADGNYRMVQALLEVGADPKLMLDTKVGNAIQAAYEKGYAKVEELLRRHK